MAMLLPAGFQAVLPGEHSIFDFGVLASNGSNVKIVNNGHTVQVVSCCRRRCDCNSLQIFELSCTTHALSAGLQLAWSL
jgi:hypothetical protein